jgi:hypothetical protein
MKKEVDMEKDDMRPEYDFSKLDKAVRGKYAKEYQQGTNLVLLDQDVARAFPDEKSVNEALRLLMTLAKNQVTTPKSGV